MSTVCFIKPRIIKSCKTCKFFKHGECLAFATQDPVSGQVINKTALESRTEKRFCGPEAVYWLQK